VAGRAGRVRATRHVIDVWHEEADPLEGLAAFVSARLLEDDGLEPGVVTFDPDDHGRELGDGRTVTGWQVFVGDETPTSSTIPNGSGCPRWPGWSSVTRTSSPLVETHDGAETSWVRGDDGRLVRHAG
jgi:hypothetical protein